MEIQTQKRAPGEAPPADDMIHNVVVVAKALKKADDGNGVNFFQFVINPESFGQTVENIFYASFLIKEGRAEMQVGDDGQILICEQLSFCHTQGVSCSRTARLTCGSAQTRTRRHEQCGQKSSSHRARRGDLPCMSPLGQKQDRFKLTSYTGSNRAIWHHGIGDPASCISGPRASSSGRMVCLIAHSNPESEVQSRGTVRTYSRYTMS